MRDIRPGTAGPKVKPPKPNVGSQHPRGQSNIALALQSRGHGGAAQPLVPGIRRSPGRSYPGVNMANLGKRESPLSALGHFADTLGQYTVGLGMVKPSHAPGNLLAGIGIHTHLPQDRPPGHALTQQELKVAQRTGKLPPHAGEASIGMVPWVPGGMASAKAELKANPARNAFHANIDKTVADKQVASRMKQAYDRNILKGAKRAGVSPGEFIKSKGSQSEVAQKVMAGLTGGRAQTLRREQEALYHAERSRRAGKVEEALQANPGREGIIAAKGELKGALPKLEYHGMRGVTDQEMEALNREVSTHPKLRPYEKITVADALLKARQGVVPTNSERKLIIKAFGPEFDKAMMAGEPWAKIRHVAIEVANIPRAVMASADVSGPGRQGIVAIARHPVITGRNLGPMLKSFKSEKFYQGRRSALESNPYYAEAKEHGLAVTDMEHALATREEPFQSNYAERLPVAGHVVRASGRAYTDFLTNSRLDIYSHLRQLADAQGHHLDPKGLRDLTGYINSATGRGNLGQFERSAVGLNAVFFSPRLIASRLDFLLPTRYMGLDPFVRAQKLRAAAQFGALLTGMLALAKEVPGVKVGSDPRSTDFGKIKIGDTRLDFTGGFQQYARVAAQLATRQTIDPHTGKPVKAKGWDVLSRFVRAKFAPTMGLGTDIATNTQYSGRPLNWKSEIASHTIPLAAQDAYGIYKNTNSIPLAVAGYGVSATGIGLQNYKPAIQRPGKVDLETALTQQVRRYFNRDLTPQLREALTLRQQRADYMKSQAKKYRSDGKYFSPKDRFNAQVDLLLKLKKISQSKADKAKAWAATESDHAVRYETQRVSSKYFGGDALKDAAAKIRAKGGHFYLSDH